MKVDKAVSTTNDAYFANNNSTVATANNLNSIIKFETVFTTLVENKILAIKRECEQHEAAKKSRTIKSLLLRKPELTDAVTAAAASDVIGNNEKNVIGKKSNKSNFFLKHKNKKQNDIDVEKGEQQGSQPQQQKQPQQQLDTDIKVVKVEVQNDNEVVNCNTDQGLHLSNNDNEHTSKLDRSQINEPLVLSSSPSIPTPTNEQLTTNNNCDKLIINSDNAQLPLSTSKFNNSSVVCSSNKEPSPQFEHDESLATTIDISLQQQSSVVVPNKSQMINKVIHNDKSDVAIYDDGPSSQNTSDIEFSLVSETSVSELPFSNRKKLAASTVLSDPIMKKTGNLLSPLLQRGVTISTPGSKPDDCKKYLPKQRSISEQSTPIFARHQQLKNEAEGKKYITFQKELPKKVVCDVKPIEKGKSQTVVIAPTVSTTTTALAKPISTITVAGTSGQETLNANKKSQKHLNKFRDIAIEYEISYDDGNQSPRGFISSFNQLTSNIPPTAVITTNSKKQSIKQSKTQSMKDGRNQHEFGRGKSFDEKAAKGHALEVELDDLAIDIDNKKRKRKSKFNYFCIIKDILTYLLATINIYL